MNAIANLQRKARLARLATLWLLALIMASIAFGMAQEPLGLAAKLFLIALLLLPLALFLRPVWRGQPRVAIWLSLFLMPYFCWAVLGAFIKGSTGDLALLRCLLIAGCFTAAMLMARWQRAISMAADATTDH